MSRRSRNDQKRLMAREIRTARGRLRGVVVSRLSQKNFDPAGSASLTWVADVDIQSNNLLRDVPIKINGPQARLYAQPGFPVFLERDASQRWQVIGPADRVPSRAVVQLLNEATDVVTAGGNRGVTLTREPTVEQLDLS